MSEHVYIDIIPICEIETEIYKNCNIEIFIINDVEMGLICI